MTKKSEKAVSEDIIYCVAKWTRKYKNNATLDGKSYSVVHDCVLSEMNDGHWEYTDHTTETEDGTDRSMGNDLIITNAETDPDQLKEFQNEPWQKHYVYRGPEELVRYFEFRNGTWTALAVE
jgi:hypothetical protein